MTAVSRYVTAVMRQMAAASLPALAAAVLALASCDHGDVPSLRWQALPCSQRCACLGGHLSPSQACIGPSGAVLTPKSLSRPPLVWRCP